MRRPSVGSSLRTIVPAPSGTARAGSSSRTGPAVAAAAHTSTGVSTAVLLTATTVGATLRLSKHPRLACGTAHAKAVPARLCEHRFHGCGPSAAAAGGAAALAEVAAARGTHLRAAGHAQRGVSGL